MSQDMTQTTSMRARWKFYPWSRNAKAICERLESLIAEVRLAEVRASDNVVTMAGLSTKAMLKAKAESTPKKLVINPIEGAIKGVPIVVSGLFFGRSAPEPMWYSLGGTDGFGLGTFSAVTTVTVREWSTTIVPHHTGYQSIAVTDGIITSVINFNVKTRDGAVQ
jgi:hypothetical protein